MKHYTAFIFWGDKYQDLLSAIIAECVGLPAYNHSGILCSLLKERLSKAAIEENVLVPAI